MNNYTEITRKVSRIFRLKNTPEVLIECGLHLDIKCFYIILSKTKPSIQYRHLFGPDRHKIFLQARLALARGSDDIYWDEKFVGRLEGHEINMPYEFGKGWSRK